MDETLIVKAKVKTAVKDMQLSADFFEELNKEVHGLVKSATKRAKANGRKTVQARDL